MILGSVILSLFFLFLAILWVLVPFAIFGAKPLLRELIKQQKETNAMLKAQNLTK